MSRSPCPQSSCASRPASAKLAWQKNSAQLQPIGRPAKQAQSCSRGSTATSWRVAGSQTERTPQSPAAASKSSENQRASSWLSNW
eukprot:10728496-Lingulodinium_polyedra.AAC.1